MVEVIRRNVYELLCGVDREIVGKRSEGEGGEKYLEMYKLICTCTFNA